MHMLGNPVDASNFVRVNIILFFEAFEELETEVVSILMLFYQLLFIITLDVAAALLSGYFS
jgi:hypothetical protein